MRVIDYEGKSKAFFSINTNGKGLPLTWELEVMRGDLVNIPYEATKDLRGVEYVFDFHIESFTQDDGDSLTRKVHVTFSNGTQDNYDVPIGADGVNSATRRLMLGPSFPNSRNDLGLRMA